MQTNKADERSTTQPIAKVVTQSVFGDIAQLVEHFNGIEGVSGSNPLISIESPYKLHL